MVASWPRLRRGLFLASTGDFNDVPVRNSSNVLSEPAARCGSHPHQWRLAHQESANSAPTAQEYNR